MDRAAENTRSERDGVSDAVAPFSFSTGDLPKYEQFGAWRDFVSSTVDLSLNAGERNGFEAQQLVWNLGSLVFTKAIMPGAGHERTWRHLKKDPVDHWCLVLVPGDEREGTSDQLSIRSLARPFEGGGSDKEVLTLFVPRDMFRDCGGSLDAAPNDIPNTGVGGLLYDYMRSLERRLGETPTAQLPHVVEATRAMIAACIVPDINRLAAARDILETSLLERARDVVRANLMSPSFSPDEFCRILGVSRSQLYRLFEPMGGVARYVHRQRLLNAYSLLSNPKNTTSIVDIAASFGFSDASGFSRAFKREFGHSPSEARAAASAGFPRPPAIAPHSRETFANLADLLARIQA